VTKEKKHKNSTQMKAGNLSSGGYFRNSAGRQYKKCEYPFSWFFRA
jgi:hypothetical protein